MKTLHHYEEQGLAEPAGRTGTGYRLYGKEEVARSMFVERAKLLGLTPKEIEELVSLAADCNDVESVPPLEDILEVQPEKTERARRSLDVPGGPLLIKGRPSEEEPERA